MHPGKRIQLILFVTANFNEKLLLSNGVTVSPLTPADGSAPSQRSMRDIVLNIDDTRDFHNYVSGYSNKIPVRTSDIKYEQHPVSSNNL